MRLRLRAAAAVMLAGLALVGCDQKSNEAKHIKVGVINGAEQDVAEVAKKVAKEKYGLEVELVGFSGSLLPNESTNAGDLDANVFQHRPFLEQDNKAHNYHLVAVGNTFVFPMAGYSRKIKSVAELKDGATIAIPNDPTNLGRALLLLQKEKLITLKAGTGLLPTAVDITDNPHHLRIMELEGAQLPRVLDDPKVDVAIISTTYLQQTGLSPVRDGIFIEDKNSPYVNLSLIHISPRCRRLSANWGGWTSFPGWSPPISSAPPSRCRCTVNSAICSVAKSCCRWRLGCFSSAPPSAGWRKT